VRLKLFFDYFVRFLGFLLAAVVALMLIFFLLLFTVDQLSVLHEFNIVVLAFRHLLWFIAEASLLVEDFSKWTSANAWLTVGKTNEELSAISWVGKPIMITETETGETLVHVWTLEVENGVSSAVGAG